MNPDLSIIIVNFNAKNYLLACLESIHQHSKKILTETIVVDNESSDGSIDEAKRKFPETIIIQNNHNAGFSRANNQGIQLAKGKFILLLNPDTLIQPNTLETLSEHAKKLNGTYVIGPKLLNHDGSLQHSAWKYPNLFDFMLEGFYLHKLFNTIGYSQDLYTKGGKCEWVSGAAMFFANDKQFLFDEIFFWMDDVDFCSEARKKSTEIIYFPGAEIIHHGGKSSSGNLSIAIPNQVISKLKFWKKHKGFFYFLTGCIIAFFFILSRTIMLLFLSPFSSLFRKKLLAYFYAMKKYFSYCFLGDTGIL